MPGTRCHSILIYRNFIILRARPSTARAPLAGEGPVLHGLSHPGILGSEIYVDNKGKKKRKRQKTRRAETKKIRHVRGKKTGVEIE
jgi:hypothetical protein